MFYYFTHSSNDVQETTTAKVRNDREAQSNGYTIKYSIWIINQLLNNIKEYYQAPLFGNFLLVGDSRSTEEIG